MPLFFNGSYHQSCPIRLLVLLAKPTHHLVPPLTIRCCDPYDYTAVNVQTFEWYIYKKYHHVIHTKISWYASSTYETNYKQWSLLTTGSRTHSDRTCKKEKLDKMHAILGTAPRKSLALLARQSCVCLITMKWNRTAAFPPVIYKLYNKWHEATMNFVNQYLQSFILGKSTAHLICLIIQPGFILAKILTFTIIGSLQKSQVNPWNVIILC
jgi:hypothetical protein